MIMAPWVAIVKQMEYGVNVVVNKHTIDYISVYYVTV